MLIPEGTWKRATESEERQEARDPPAVPGTREGTRSAEIPEAEVVLAHQERPAEPRRREELLSLELMEPEVRMVVPVQTLS